MTISRYERLFHEEAPPAFLAVKNALIGIVDARSVNREMELVEAFKGNRTEAYPFVDDRARQAAESLGLPKSPRTLADLVDGPQETTRLAAALARLDLGSQKATEELLEAA